MLKILKGFIPKLRFMFMAIIAIIVLGLFFKDDVARHQKAKIVKAEVEEIARGSAATQNRMELWVTADLPSCFTVPVGPFTIYPIGKEGSVKFIYPDGYVARVGPKERIIRNFEGGERICVILDNGETTPIRMGLRT